jgi:hypothetical protein
MILRLLNEVAAALEYLGGVRERPPERWLSWMQAPIWWGIWWALLILLALSFSGQTSKFIYIDF